MSKSQLVSTTRKNQFELVTGSFNDKEKPVLSQFLEELVCLCHAVSFNNQEEPVLS